MKGGGRPKRHTYAVGHYIPYQSVFYLTVQSIEKQEYQKKWHEISQIGLTKCNCPSYTCLHSFPMLVRSICVYIYRICSTKHYLLYVFFRFDEDLADGDPETNGIMTGVLGLKTSRIFSKSQRWLRSLLPSITVTALFLYGLYFKYTLLWITSLCILFIRDFYMKVSVRRFERHCFCQTADWRRHREKCCANEIAWPTSFSAIHFSKDTERAFIQVNHDWSLTWKKGFQKERGASIIYYTGVARHLGDNALLQAYKTWSLLRAGKAIVVFFEHVCFHPYWQMKKNMSP